MADIVRPVDQRFSSFSSKIAAESESVAEDPNVAIYRNSQEMRLYYGIFCTCRIRSSEKSQSIKVMSQKKKKIGLVRSLGRRCDWS